MGAELIDTIFFIYDGVKHTGLVKKIHTSCYVF